MTAFKIL